jgi:hypothetical protein
VVFFNALKYLSKMAKNLYFGSMSGKFGGIFRTKIDQKLSQLQKNIFRKQKIMLLLNFDH